jgi:putative heme transporter
MTVLDFCGTAVAVRADIATALADPTVTEADIASRRSDVTHRPSDVTHRPADVTHRPADDAAAVDHPVRRPRRRWVRPALVSAVLVVVGVELALGWRSLAAAFAQLHSPAPAWVAAAVLTEVAAMSAYARMQRHLLRSAGVRVRLRRSVALAYAAHSLNETLPGGPAFSIRFNFQQMRRFGAGPAVASWTIALSGVLSTTALALVTAGGALAADGAPPWLSLAGLALVIVLLSAGIRHLTRHPAALEPALRAVLAPINRLRRRPVADGLDQVRGFVAQLGSARLTPGHGLAAAAYALLNWLFDAVALWMCLRAVSDGPIDRTQLLLTFCAGMAAATLTIVPGGLGIVDNALILGLLTGGVATTAAIAAVVLYRLITFGFIIGLGWISWAVLRSRPAADAHDRVPVGV